MQMVEQIPTEHQEQRTFVQWFRRAFPDIRIFAIPNGGARRPSVACKLKAEGVSKGVPDLFIPAWKMFIEMKRIKGGQVSDDQKNWIAHLKKIGYTVFIGKGFEGAKKEVEQWLTSQKF